MADSVEVREFTAVEVQGHERVEILDSAATEIQETLYVEVGVGGPQGPPGPPGSGVSNVFIQPTAPVTTVDQYIWIETTADEGDVVTFWVET